MHVSVCVHVCLHVCECVCASMHVCICVYTILYISTHLKVRCTALLIDCAKDVYCIRVVEVYVIPLLRWMSIKHTEPEIMVRYLPFSDH